MNDRALALAKQRAETALAAAKAGKPLAPVRLGSETIAPEETGVFGRGTPFVPKIGEAAGVLQDAFAGQAGQPLPKVYDTPAGPVVAVVKQRETPDPKAFEAQREAIETRLRRRKESQVEGAWVRSLRDGARIETNETLVATASDERRQRE